MTNLSESDQQSLFVSVHKSKSNLWSDCINLDRQFRIGEEEQRYGNIVGIEREELGSTNISVIPHCYIFNYMGMEHLVLHSHHNEIILVELEGETEKVFGKSCNTECKQLNYKPERRTLNAVRVVRVREVPETFDISYSSSDVQGMVNVDARSPSDKTAKKIFVQGSRLGCMSHKWNWFLLATITFLWLLGRNDCFDLMEDDEFKEASSPFSNIHRKRRSAEAFSTVKYAENVLIPSDYSIHEPPPTNNSDPTKVDFSVLIMNVRDIKEFDEELSLEMNFRIYWKDTRLGHLADPSGKKFVLLNPFVLGKIWHPDVFIDHLIFVSQPAVISKTASLRMYPDSSLRHSARYSISVACQMDFHYYPADTQRCNVDLKSYAYSSKVLLLGWREGKGALLVDYLELSNFDVALDTTQNFMVNTSSGSYSGVRFTILLRRKLSYHLIQTYLPSTLLIVISWLSFLVPLESMSDRMTLCTTTLLTLTTMFNTVRESTPNVSYVKALDIWMIVCIFFVFLTLVEFAVLFKLKSKKPKPNQQQAPPPPSPSPNPINITNRKHASQSALPTTSHRSYGEHPTIQIRHTKLRETAFNGNEAGDGTRPSSDPNTQTHPLLQFQPPSHSPAPEKPLLNKYELAVNKIENFSSAIIPTLFVVFNFIYWPWLIESSHYYSVKTIHGSN